MGCEVGRHFVSDKKAPLHLLTTFNKRKLKRNKKVKIGNRDRIGKRRSQEGQVTSSWAVKDEVF